MSSLPRTFATAFLAAAALLVSAAPSHAASDFDDLAAPGADPAVLADQLPLMAGRLARGSSKIRYGKLTYCAPGTDAEREKGVVAISEAIERGVEALKRAGYTIIGKPPALIVVEVSVPSEPTSVVMSSDKKVLLIRRGAAARSGQKSRGFPSLKTRDDGPPIARDAAEASDRLRAALWRAASNVSGSGGGEASGLADHLLRWSGVPDSVPAWYREGLLGWLTREVDGGAPEMPDHLCDAGSGPDSAKLFANDSSSAGVTELRTRLIAHLIGKEIDLVAHCEQLDADTPDAFDKAFGLKGAEALAAVTASLSDLKASCENGRIPCTVCVGEGAVELACPDCAGTSATGCPACLGTDDCFSSTCIGGWHYYSGDGDKVKCRFCGGRGSVKCKACGGKGRATCTTCRKGKVERPCLTCDDGSLPCPYGGPTAELREACGDTGAKCHWCARGELKTACGDCGGTGNRGCKKCFGTLRQLCFGCGGTGEQKMVYSDGTTASSTKCPRCSGKGYSRCGDCKSGKLDCAKCVKGVVALESEDCQACDADGVVPSVAASISRIRAQTAPADAAESELTAKMMKDAVKFLLTCNKTASGAFALRDFRKDKKASAGKLREPSLFANADVIWTLSTVGIDKDDPRIARAWTALRKDAAATTASDGTQEVSLALRALISGGEDPQSDLIEHLVNLLVKGQRRNGLWADALDDEEDGVAYTALYPLETLRVAQRKGAKVPRSVWQKALRAANAQFDARGPKDFNKEYITGTRVASATALVVITKAGTLGDKAGTFDYTTLPGVERGLAWLDRHFDIRHQPIFSSGARVRDDGDQGYAAYLFAVQRLGMLLSIEVLGGERWHVTGARHLRGMQLPDGSFEESGSRRLNGPVRTTSSAILFLARATPAITGD